MDGGMPPRTSIVVDDASSSASSSSSGSESSPPQRARAGGTPSAAQLNASVDVGNSPATLPPAIARVSNLVVVSPGLASSCSVSVVSVPSGLATCVRSCGALTGWTHSAQEGIKRSYSEKIRPVEMMYGFEAFRDVATDSEFEAKPSVLLIGQCAALASTSRPPPGSFWQRT